MPHAASTPPVPPPAPVPVLGQCAPLSEQSTPWEIFTALARVGIHFLLRFLPFTATLARSYPRHWRAFLESSSALVLVLLTVRFAPERITVAQFRRLWRARQLIESLFGRPLPIFHSIVNQSPSASPLGARTPSSANATLNEYPSASPENATPLGPRTSSSATATAHQHPSSSLNPAPAAPLGARTPSSATTPSPALPAASSPNPPSPASPGNPQSAIPNPHPHTPQPRTPNTPSTPAVPQVPCCSLSHFPSRSRSDAPSASESRSRAHKHAPATLQSIIAQMEAQEAQSQASSPHSAFPIPHSSMPPFIPDVNTLHAALKADTLPPNCAGALLDKPGDTLIRALQQVHALLHAFPQLSPSQSPSNLQLSICNLQSNAPSVHSVHPVHNVHSVPSPSPAQSEIHTPAPASPHSAFPTPPSEHSPIHPAPD